MIRSTYDWTTLVDTSAVIALFDASDQFHNAARTFFDAQVSVQWVALNATSHETFTRTRYSAGFAAAAQRYDFVRSLALLNFTSDDETEARRILEKYRDQALSFHDSLCAAVMKRQGIYKVFTFDKDFWVLGFEVVPGATQ